MTAIGIVVAAPGLAFSWADTMTTQGGVSSGEQVKLAANAIAGLVAVGTGWSPIVAAARDAAAAALSLRGLLDDLPGILRHAVTDLAERVPEPETMAKNKILISGWHDSWRRIVAYRLSGQDFFVPELITAEASPPVNGLAALHPTIDADLDGEIVDQLDTLRRFYGFPVSGRVAIATVRPQEISTRVLHLPVAAGMLGLMATDIEQQRAAVSDTA